MLHRLACRIGWHSWCDVDLPTHIGRVTRTIEVPLPGATGFYWEGREILRVCIHCGQLKWCHWFTDIMRAQTSESIQVQPNSAPDHIAAENH